MGSWRGVDRAGLPAQAIAEDIPTASSPKLDGMPGGGFNPHGAEERIMTHLERIDNRQRRQRTHRL